MTLVDKFAILWGIYKKQLKRQVSFFMVHSYIEPLEKALQNASDLLAPEQVGDILREHVPPMFADDDFLPPELRDYDKDEPYTRHIVHDGGDWVLQSLVWAPGAMTPIHNHHCWCSFGAYQGEMVEERFKEQPNGDVVCSESTTYTRGMFGSLTPTGKDIHRMVNKTDEVAITLHFYGLNAFKNPSSILVNFDGREQIAKQQAG